MPLGIDWAAAVERPVRRGLPRSRRVRRAGTGAVRGRWVGTCDSSQARHARPSKMTAYHGDGTSRPSNEEHANSKAGDNRLRFA